MDASLETGGGPALAQGPFHFAAILRTSHKLESRELPAMSNFRQEIQSSVVV